MGRYSTRYWDNRASFAEEVVGTMFTAGLINLADDPPIGHGCEITDKKLGIVGITHELKPSKDHAHDAAWNDLLKNTDEYHKSLKNERNNISQHQKDDDESDLTTLLIKWGIYLALIVGTIWLAFAVVLPILLINCALISLVFGFTLKKNKNYIFILSLIGAIFILVDYNKGWLTNTLVNNVSFFAGFIPFFLYLNISAGLIASYFLIRDLIDEKRPPLKDDNEFSKRNLIIMVSLLCIGGIIVWAHTHFSPRKSFHIINSNYNNQRTVNNMANYNLADNIKMGDSTKMADSVKMASVGDANTPTQYAQNNNTNNGTFTGDYFQINFPPNFIVKPSLKSKLSTSGYESAFFQSPDSLIEFYIFHATSKEDEATDIAINQIIEKITSTFTQKSKGNTITWSEIQALDSSYFRAYQETKNNDGSLHCIVGLKYKSKFAYDKYKPEYLAFKKSLVEVRRD